MSQSSRHVRSSHDGAPPPPPCGPAGAATPRECSCLATHQESSQREQEVFVYHKNNTTMYMFILNVTMNNL